MDKIKLNDIPLYGYHGVLPAEKELGQKFFVSLEISLDLSKAGRSDNLEYTINYVELYKIAKDVVTNNKLNLIETIGEKIAEKILEKYSQAVIVKVRVRKPNIPELDFSGEVLVEIRTKKENLFIKKEGNVAKVYLSLGSNMGDRIGEIEKAINLLNDNEKITVTKVSSFYETEPVEYPDQAWFVNSVVEIETELEPEKLLETTLKIESDMQRERTIRWGPRNIDIDILLYENELVSTSNLQIPHLRMNARAFVLIPLAEIAPDLKHPVLNKTAEELYDQIINPTTVKKIGKDREIEVQAV